MLYTSWFENSEGDAMNDPEEFSCVDELMDWMTIIFLVLMTITFLGVVAGFIWGML